MTPKLKIEIRLYEGEWQWLGRLTKAQLRQLCDYATSLTDEEL